MAVRKTQKKHLGKKRKSLSKRKAHSKKKRHSKQRITKKRSHKGGGDNENTDEDGSTVGNEYTAYNPLTKEMVEEERRKAKEEEEERQKADNLKRFSEKSIQEGLDRFKQRFHGLGGGKAHSKKRTTKKTLS